MTDLWVEVRDKCLTHVKALLDCPDATDKETLNTVCELVQISIAIDLLNLRLAQQTRFGAAVFRGKPSSQQATEN